MTDLHPLLFIMAALAAAGFVMHRFGLKPALGALAAAGAVGLALFRGRRAMGAVTAPPPAPRGAGAAVAKEAAAIVTEQAATERAAIAKAAEDPDALAATMRGQQ